MSLFLKSILLVCLLNMVNLVYAEQQATGDYHVTEYRDGLGYVSDVELFTKDPDKKVFFGITCSSMSALPLIQILLFDKEVLSESPKLVKIEYDLDGKVRQGVFNGVLKFQDSVDEYSNKIIFDAKTDQIKSLSELKSGYQNFFEDIRHSQNQDIVISLNHRSFKTKAYVFSLRGLKPLIEKYQKICF